MNGPRKGKGKGGERRRGNRVLLLIFLDIDHCSHTLTVSQFVSGLSLILSVLSRVLTPVCWQISLSQKKSKTLVPVVVEVTD